MAEKLYTVLADQPEDTSGMPDRQDPADVTDGSVDYYDFEWGEAEEVDEATVFAGCAGRARTYRCGPPCPPFSCGDDDGGGGDGGDDICEPAPENVEVDEYETVAP